MLTTACNFKCVYCYQRRSAPRTMSNQVLDAAIRRLVSSRLDRPSLTLYGGEPLLAAALVRRALDRVRAWAPTRMHPDIQIVTNGTRLDEETARLLVRRDVFITLSFDGVAPAQDDRRPGSFESLDALLVRLRRDHPRHFRRRLGVKATLTPGNVTCLADSVRYFLSRGLASIDVVPVFSDGGRWNPARARELDGQLRDIVRMSTGEFRRSGDIPFLGFRSPGGPSTLSDTPVCGCGSHGLLFVDVDGSLAPCAAMARSTLGPAPDAVRPLVKAFRDLKVSDTDLDRALARCERRATRLPILAGPQRRAGPVQPCARCRLRSACFVCPMAIALNGGRVPAFHCDVNRLFARHRAAFRRRVGRRSPGRATAR